METERTQRAAAQADNMRAYYRGRQLPPAPLKITSWITITDTPRYVSGNLNRLNLYPVLSRYWLNAYYALYHLKKFIDGHDAINGCDNSTAIKETTS